MNGKIQSDYIDREQIQEMGGISSRNWAGQYGEKKYPKKRNIIGNRLPTEGKISTYTSSSKMTSYMKGHSLSQADNFKATESVYLNQLAQKYAPRGSPLQKIKQQMELVLERKKSEIQALRVHRDELKFISFNNPYDKPIKMSLAVLKEKARTQQKIKDMTLALQKDIKQIQFEFNTMTDYYNFITNSLKSSGDDDLIIDTKEEEQLMINNLQKQTNHLFKQLKEEDKKNAREIKTMQEEIGVLRVNIKVKQDKIRDLKSMICTLHIKLHSRGSSSKEKNMSMSVRKFITQQNKSIQEVFLGNQSFKHYSKQIIEKVDSKQELLKILFYYEPKRESITFKCIYRKAQGKLHSFMEEQPSNQPINITNIIQSPLKPKRQNVQIPTEIKLKYLLSMKFFFKSKIVGIECRTKSQKGTQHIQIGNCSSNLEHQLLTLVNKKVVTLGSYWHHRDMIGLGIWHCRQGGVEQKARSKSKENTRLRNAKSIGNLNKQKVQCLNEQYYLK